MKSASLNLLEPSLPVQASTGIALLLAFTVEMAFGSFYSKLRKLIWAAHRISALINGTLFVSTPVNRDLTFMFYFEIKTNIITRSIFTYNFQANKTPGTPHTNVGHSDSGDH